MALQKHIALPNGTSGNYIRLTFYRWDATRREASAEFMLFASKERAKTQPHAPVCALIKLRLSEAKFDQYLSTEALQALEIRGPDPIRDQLYAAVKVEPLIAGGGLTEAELRAFNLATAADV